MKFLRPIFGGLVFLASTALLASVPIIIATFRYPQRDGYFFEFHWHLGWLALISLFAFSAGFFFQYRGK